MLLCSLVVPVVDARYLLLFYIVQSRLMHTLLKYCSYTTNVYVESVCIFQRIVVLQWCCVCRYRQHQPKQITTIVRVDYPSHNKGDTGWRNTPYVIHELTSGLPANQCIGKNHAVSLRTMPSRKSSMTHISTQCNRRATSSWSTKRIGTTTTVWLRTSTTRAEALTSSSSSHTHRVKTI